MAMTRLTQSELLKRLSLSSLWWSLVSSLLLRARTIELFIITTTNLVLPGILPFMSDMTILDDFIEPVIPLFHRVRDRLAVNDVK